MKAFAQAYEEGSGRKHAFVLAYGGSYAKKSHAGHRLLGADFSRRRRYLS